MSFAGSFLVARPMLSDPSFAHAVVLLLAHNPDGAFGLVVNRPAKAENLPFPLFVGGPCPSPGLFMLHGHSEWTEPESEGEEEAKQEIVPGIFIGDSSCLNKASNPALEQVLRLRVFTGYAGWGGGQLEKELAVGAWALMPATSQVLFDTPVDELWDRLMPTKIPQPSIN